MKKLKGLFRLIRFELPFAAGICTIVGMLLASGSRVDAAIAAAAFASVFLVSASILVLNDYFDVETDRINAPGRPIPSNLVTPFEALLFSMLLIAGGLSTGLLISINSFVICIILAAIGFLYNRYFKKSGLPGNLMVSFSVGMTFVFGGAAAGDPFGKPVILFALIAALIDLGEEIAADAMDAEGDKLINSASIAIRRGRSFAIKLSSYIFFTVIALTFLPFIFGWFSLFYAIPLGIMDMLIALPLYKLLKSIGEEGRKYIRLIYLGANFGMLVFLVMKLIGI